MDTRIKFGEMWTKSVPQSFLKIEEGGRGISQSGAMWEGLNLPFLALKMEKKGYEPRDVGRL